MIELVDQHQAEDITGFALFSQGDDIESIIPDSLKNVYTAGFHARPGFPSETARQPF